MLRIIRRLRAAKHERDRQIALRIFFAWALSFDAPLPPLAAQRWANQVLGRKRFPETEVAQDSEKDIEQ